jgi:hypothetical protein
MQTSRIRISDRFKVRDVGIACHAGPPCDVGLDIGACARAKPNGNSMSIDNVKALLIMIIDLGAFRGSQFEMARLFKAILDKLKTLHMPADFSAARELHSYLTDMTRKRTTPCGRTVAS